mmetsp:Transcript_23944/g.21778  ORF Transcript_23944/g.21778 Transcript_23944/m.21778 type:complete len:264 (-) Transcript_23944:22-813(-)
MPRTVGTSNTQYKAIVEWLENPTNFNIVVGNSLANKSGVVFSNKNLTKKSGFESLAIYVNQSSGSNWDDKKARARYDRYLEKYKEVKKLYLSNSDTKYGLSDIDIKKGILTIEDKLEKACEYFRRMDNLFGDRQNIKPAVTLEPNVFVNNISPSFNYTDNDQLQFDNCSIKRSSSTEYEFSYNTNSTDDIFNNNNECNDNKIDEHSDSSSEYTEEIVSTKRRRTDESFAIENTIPSMISVCENKTSYSSAVSNLSNIEPGYPN